MVACAMLRFRGIDEAPAIVYFAGKQNPEEEAKGEIWFAMKSHGIHYLCVLRLIFAPWWCHATAQSSLILNNFLTKVPMFPTRIRVSAFYNFCSFMGHW